MTPTQKKERREAKQVLLAEARKMLRKQSGLSPAQVKASARIILDRWISDNRPNA